MGSVGGAGDRSGEVENRRERGFLRKPLEFPCNRRQEGYALRLIQITELDVRTLFGQSEPYSFPSHAGPAVVCAFGWINPSIG